MKNPELLNGHSLAVKARLNPIEMSISLKADELSSAQIKLDRTAPAVTVGEWIRIYAPNGDMFVSYVKTQTSDYINGQVTLNCEHIFGLLDEDVMFGEVTPQMMGGGDKVAASAAMRYVLSKQHETMWVFGGCDFTDTQGWKFTNSTVRNALDDIREAIPDCQWEYDQTVYPFKLSLKHQPTTVTMEMRKNRNLSTMKVTLDRSQMYTRVYPIGNKNLHITGDYIDRNTDIWGVISQTITDSTIQDEGLLRSWATAQIKRNAEPVITVSVAGFELSEATGEPMDHFRVGKLCRIPLPDYGVTVTQRMVELSWRSVILDPVNVTITLANEHKTIQNVMNKAAKSGGKSSSKNGCDLEDDEEKLMEFENSDIWINKDTVWAVSAQYDVITDQAGRHVRLKSGALLEIEREAGVYQTVGDIIGDQDRSIEGLDTWVDDFQGSALWTQRDNITGVCGEYAVEYYTEGGALKKRLRIKNGTGLVMERNGATFGVYDSGNLTGGVMVKAINGQTTLKLKADTIDIDGVVSGLKSKEIQCLGLEANTATFDDYVYSTQGFQTGSGSFSCNAGTFNVIDVIPKGNTLTIKYANGTSQNFSKATTLSGEFSGLGPFVVTASPQGNTFPVYVEFAHLGSVPVVRPAESGSNTMAISLDVGTLGADGKRTVSAKAGNNVAASRELTDYADGRASVSTRPSVINVYSSNPGTYLGSNLAASALTAGKYIGITVAGTVYSVLIV